MDLCRIETYGKTSYTCISHVTARMLADTHTHTHTLVKYGKTLD